MKLGRVEVDEHLGRRERLCHSRNSCVIFLRTECLPKVSAAGVMAGVASKLASL